MDDAGNLLRHFRNRDGFNGNTADYENVVNLYLPTRERPRKWREGTLLPAPDLTNDAFGLPAPDLANDAFGLPIQFHSESRSANAKADFGGKPRIDAKVGWEGQGKSHSRRASPLMIRPLWCGQPFDGHATKGSYAIMWLIFRSRFLPEGAVEWLAPINGRNWPKDITPPAPCPIRAADLAVLDDFLDSVGKQLGVLCEFGFPGTVAD